MDFNTSLAPSQLSPEPLHNGPSQAKDSPSLLTDFETCPRKAFWSPHWRRNKLSSKEVVLEAIQRTLVATAPQGDEQWGDYAGSQVFELASCPGMDSKEGVNLFDSVMHHACLADILVSVIRKMGEKAWIRPDPVQNWTSNCLSVPAGTLLRRIVLVSHWSTERHYSECRNWYTLGEMAAYDLPMQLVVFVIGPERNGQHHSHWTKALLHPANLKTLRFRRRSGNSKAGFNEKWIEIWRENRDEISRDTWLNCMLQDDVLRDLAFTVDVPAMTQPQRRQISDMAARKLEAIAKMTEKPDKQLTGCEWPVKCPFLKCCHVPTEQEPSEKLGFVRISPHMPAPLAGSCRLL